MSTVRPRTLVVDFSALPSRPEASAVEDFIYNEMKLEQTDAKSIQFHNIHHCVYIEMANDEKPLEYERAHNCKHQMKVDGKRYPIPVFRDNDAVKVRIHDLPTSIDQKVVIDHMSQYGTVLGVRWEYWRNFFGGIKNGVRILRMHVVKPIPSYIKIGLYESLVTHSGNQIKTCRFCVKPVHPKTKCVIVPQYQTGAATTQQTISPEDYPALTPPNNPTLDLTKTGEAEQKQQQQYQQDQQSDTEDDTSSSTESIPAANSKRRLSAKKAKNKKPCQNNSPSGSAASQNVFVCLSPMASNTDGN